MSESEFERCITEMQDDPGYARKLDALDPLASCRNEFHVPCSPQGTPLIYFCGNSLGLQPKSARQRVVQELTDWADLAVDAHFEATTPWYFYHEQFLELGARLVGARPGEVVMMNSLTVNLHLMMVSFYRPTRQRCKILVDSPTFPSDTYALKSQLQFHGHDPEHDLIEVRPPTGEHCVRTADIEEVLAAQGSRIALVLIGGVNYFTGQVYDLQRISAAARDAGCVVGFDLAHAAGNVELQLHDWQIDFAVWCSYKYLNAGPGAVAGCFVHRRHWDQVAPPRFAGWWGNDPRQRFKMHLLPDFVPQPGAAGWQISNPPILSMAPLRASLDIFDRVGMRALRKKSVALTGYLQFLLDQAPANDFEVVTPRAVEQRGCQFSILVRDQAVRRWQALKRAGVVCDFREPDVVRVAPVPLYNTFEEVWRFARILRTADTIEH